MKNKNFRKLKYVSGNPQNAGFCTIYPTDSGGLGGPQNPGLHCSASLHVCPGEVKPYVCPGEVKPYVCPGEVKPYVCPGEIKNYACPGVVRAFNTCSEQFEIDAKFQTTLHFEWKETKVKQKINI
jgi:hypothetical protein